MKLALAFSTVFIALVSTTGVLGVAIAAAPTAAPRLEKRVFPTGSAAVASFLSTVDPAELSTYFSWAANGNDGFISHAQSFTSANAAQYSSYLSGKGIDASQASAILGGIQTKSTEAAGAQATGDSSGTESGGSSSTDSNGNVVVAAFTTDSNGSIIAVSTTNADGALVAASSTVSGAGATATGASASATSSGTTNGASSSAASSHVNATSSTGATSASATGKSSSDGAIKGVSTSVGGAATVIIAIAAYLVL